MLGHADYKAYFYIYIFNSLVEIEMKQSHGNSWECFCNEDHDELCSLTEH
jgi:hypothetical protein